MSRMQASGKPQRRVSEHHLEHILMEFDQHLAESVAASVSGGISDYHEAHTVRLFLAARKLVRRLAKRQHRRVQTLEARVAALEIRIVELERPWWRKLWR